MTPEEFLLLLETYLPQLHTDVSALMAQASHMTAEEFVKYAAQAYPEVVTPHVAVAAELAAAWYDEAGGDARYAAVTAPLPPVEQLQQSLSWALSTPSPGLNLAGSAERMFYQGARSTIVDNANTEQGATWARHAEPTACPFCKLMATRGSVYSSKLSATKVVGRGFGTRQKKRGTQDLGESYHDHCKCIAVMVRPGGSYHPPEYAATWQAEYEKAKANATHTGDPKSIIQAWRQLDNQ